MQKNINYLLLSTFLGIHVFSLHAMLNRVTTQGQRLATQARAAAFSRRTMPITTMKTTIGAGQKRTFYTPEAIKRLSILPPEVRSISPAYGIAKKESGVLQKMYAIKSEEPAPGVQLVQELYHQIGNQFKPTNHIANPACALSPGILGLIIGAAKENLLENTTARTYILHEWRTEYEKIARETKRSNGTVRSPKEVDKLMNVIDAKIDKLITLIDSVYKGDNDTGRDIMLSFFADKANLTSDHDMMDYLSGINRFLPLAANNTFDKQSNLNQLQELEKTEREYTAKDYATLKEQLDKIDQNKTMKFASQNFELLLATILNEKREEAIYPPAVVRSSYGYKGQYERSNCVETMFQDLFNILLYDQQTTSFDLSLLPSSIHCSETFKTFYENYKDSNQINTPQAGQAFMDMVSGIDGVSYRQSNYELLASETGTNIFALMKHLLNIDAHNLQELGTLLSDDRRTVTFIMHKPDENNFTEISMTIKNHQTDIELHADLCFKPGHGEISVPERTLGTNSLLSPQLLVDNYLINSEARALLNVQIPEARRVTLEQKINTNPASLYYAFETPGDWSKSKLIKDILSASPNNKEALDYALHLYELLDFQEKADLLSSMLKSEILRSNPKFTEIIMNIKDQIRIGSNQHQKQTIIESIVQNAKSTDVKLLDYALELYEQLNNKAKDDAVDDILNSGAWRFHPKLKELVINYISQIMAEKYDSDSLGAYCQHRTLESIIFNVKDREFSEYISNLFNQLPFNYQSRIYEKVFFYALEDVAVTLYEHSDDIIKKKLLADALNYCTSYAISPINKKHISIVKKLIALGSPVNFASTLWGRTPLFSAIEMNNLELVKLLVENGADVNQMNERGQTPLDIASNIDIKYILMEANGKTSTQLKPQQDTSKTELLSREGSPTISLTERFTRWLQSWF